MASSNANPAPEGAGLFRWADPPSASSHNSTTSRMPTGSTAPTDSSGMVTRRPGSRNFQTAVPTDAGNHSTGSTGISFLRSAQAPTDVPTHSAGSANSFTFSSAPGRRPVALEKDISEMKAHVRAEQDKMKEDLLDKLKAYLATEQSSIKESLLEQMMGVFKNDMAAKNQELSSKFDAILNARVEGIVNRVDDLSKDFEERNDSFDGVPSLLLKLAQSSAKNTKDLAAAEKRLAGRLDDLKASSTAEEAPQHVQRGAANCPMDQRNEEEAATAKATNGQQSIALIQAATTAAASLGGQAKVTLSVTANSFTFSINNEGPTSSLPTTSTQASSSGQNLDDPRSSPNVESDSMMPPAKRLRTGETDGGQDKGGSRDRSASETLVGDDDEEEGTGQ